MIPISESHENPSHLHTILQCNNELLEISHQSSRLLFLAGCSSHISNCFWQTQNVREISMLAAIKAEVLYEHVMMIM